LGRPGKAGGEKKKKVFSGFRDELREGDDCRKHVTPNEKEAAEKEISQRGNGKKGNAKGGETHFSAVGERKTPCGGKSTEVKKGGE